MVEESPRRRRRPAPPPRKAGRADTMEERVAQRLDSERQRVASVLDKAGSPLLHAAARRLPPALRATALETGDRVLRDTTARLQQTSAQEWLEAVRRALQAHPGGALAGLVGAGLVSGRVARVVADAAGGPQALLARAQRAGHSLDTLLRRLSGPGGTALVKLLQAKETLQGVGRTLGANVEGGRRNVRQGVEKTKKDAAKTAADARKAAQNIREHLGEAGKSAKENIRGGLQRAISNAGKPTRPHGPPPHRVGAPAPRAPGLPRSVVEARVRTRKAPPPPVHPTGPGAGYLGLETSQVRLSPSTARVQGTRGGLLVLRVAPEGPAASAGLQPGDTLLSLEGHPLQRVGDLLPYLAAGREGHPLQAKVLRAGEARELTLVPRAPPPSGRQ